MQLCLCDAQSLRNRLAKLCILLASILRPLASTNAARAVSDPRRRQVVRRRSDRMIAQAYLFHYREQSTTR